MNPLSTLNSEERRALAHMSDNEWELTYASPNAVSRAQQQTDLASRVSAVSDDSEWACVYSEGNERDVVPLDRTAEPDPSPSDQEACM